MSGAIERRRTAATPGTCAGRRGCPPTATSTRSLRAAKIAKTILFLPHPDVEVSGTVEFGGRRIEVDGARGGQAHLWGSKHANRWAWAHCNDFVGRGPATRAATPSSTGSACSCPASGARSGPTRRWWPASAARTCSRSRRWRCSATRASFDLTSWRFEARALRRKLVGEVTARKEDLVGVTYHDPDGELAYCYNTEVADMQLELFERRDAFTSWRKRDELRSDGRAHFEYAQREPRRGRRAEGRSDERPHLRWRARRSSWREPTTGVLVDRGRACPAPSPPSAPASAESARAPTERSTSASSPTTTRSWSRRNRELLASALGRDPAASRWAARCTAPTSQVTASAAADARARHARQRTCTRRTGS